jgi:hypothetical protein
MFAFYRDLLGLPTTRVIASACLSPELTDDAAVVGLDPLVGEAAFVVVAEDVDQLEGRALAVRPESPSGLAHPRTKVPRSSSCTRN